MPKESAISEEIDSKKTPSLKVKDPAKTASLSVCILLLIVCTTVVSEISLITGSLITLSEMGIVAS